MGFFGEVADFVGGVASDFGKMVSEIGSAATDSAKKTLNTAAGTSNARKSQGRYKRTPGDVVGVARNGFDHYGVYVGDDKVIHYSSPDSDTDPRRNRIIKTSFDTFLRGSKEFFVLEFPEKHDAPSKTAYMSLTAWPHYHKIPFNIFDAALDARKLIKRLKYVVNSPEKTIENAESRLGEKAYSLPFNNCEHFAIWCKTGISESHQVESVIASLKNIGSNRTIAR